MFIKAMRLSDEMHYINVMYYEKLVFSTGKLLSLRLRSLKNYAVPADGMSLPLPQTILLFDNVNDQMII